MAGSDFNYKVALASGVRSLQAGQPKKAEEQFRYLRDHFPHADGGYRGLAKVRIGSGDPAGALAVLRAGAAALAKAGERSAAIGLLREILTLDPLDLGVHRRLAAAYILSGDRASAVAEYERFVRLVIGEIGGDARVRLEVAYAREQLGDREALAEVVSVLATRTKSAPAWVPPVPDQPVARTRTTDDGARPVTVSPLSADDLEIRAVRALTTKDPTASGVVIAAAGMYLEAGRVDAAADLLLAALAAGTADRAAERLFIDVAVALGAKAAAREGAALLARLHQLDGRGDLAVELERLARAV